MAKATAPHNSKTLRLTLGVVLTLLIFFAGQTEAQLDPVLTKTFGKANQVSVTMEAIDHSELKITATFPKSSWFGLGFGSDMVTAELVMFLAHSDTSLIRVI